jgi:hypothetical protein
MDPPDQRERAYRVISMASSRLNGAADMLEGLLLERAARPDGSIDTDVFMAINQVHAAMKTIGRYRR